MNDDHSKALVALGDKPLTGGDILRLMQAAQDAAYEHAASECEKYAKSPACAEQGPEAITTANYCADFLRCLRSDA